jgi:rod shape-determining protein MreD
VRALISFVVSLAVAAVAVVLQVTVVDRIAFPGGAGPDLVLLTVAALALAGGPLIGALTGFWAGLALDVAPPGSHFVGQNALVFCLVGYACGLLSDESSPDAEQGHTALFEILVTAAGAVCGEVLAALLGVMLSDPRVTWPAVTRVLPVAVAYDVLLCPFVLYAVAAALRLAGRGGESRRAGWTASQVRDPVPSASQGAIRQLAAGSGPRLRLSERDKGSGPVGGGLYGPGGARREPQLKLGGAQRTPAAAFAAGGLSAGSPKVRFGGRRREGVLGGSLLGGASAHGSALRGSALSASRFGSSTMGRSLLGGSVFSRSSAPPGATFQFGRTSRTAVFGRPSRTALFGRTSRPVPLVRSSPFGHRGNALRQASGGLAGTAPRGGFARLAAALRPSARPKSPGRGWLRGASAGGGSSLRGTSPRRSPFRRSSLRGSSLRGSSLRGSSPARGSLGGRTTRTRLRMPRPKTKQRWRTRRWRTGGYR